jgi:lipopolysaccharide/colanic/teichoic acid biosynthesis glycosyltransferase
VKRLLDVLFALVGLLLSLPVLLPLMVLIWWQDGHSPFYSSTRVGKGGLPFQMVKLRSMVNGADRSGVDSTRTGDPRVTPLGRFIRRYKLDELPQLWNVLTGAMSLVGPRPQVEREAALYTQPERQLLDVRPGVTDIASIVFSDLADILRDQRDVNIAYNQLVRPRKSRLGLFYVEHRSIRVDLTLIGLTALAIVSRRRALLGVERLLRRLGANQDLRDLAARKLPLVPMPPPGADRIVTSREIAVSHHGLIGADE